MRAVARRRRRGQRGGRCGPRTSARPAPPRRASPASPAWPAIAAAADQRHGGPASGVLGGAAAAVRRPLRDGRRCAGGGGRRRWWWRRGGRRQRRARRNRPRASSARRSARSCRRGRRTRRGAARHGPAPGAAAPRPRDRRGPCGCRPPDSVATARRSAPGPRRLAQRQHRARQARGERIGHLRGAGHVCSGATLTAITCASRRLPDRRAARPATPSNGQCPRVPRSLCAETGAQSSDGFGKQSGLRQQAHHQERAARAGRRSSPGAPARLPRSPGRWPRPRRCGSRARARSPSTRPAPAAACSLGRGASARASAPRLVATRAAIAARMPAPSANSSGSACCTGVADRQIGVGDQLQPGERRVGVAPADHDPAELQVRQPARLRQPAQAEERARPPPLRGERHRQTRVGIGRERRTARTPRRR